MKKWFLLSLSLCLGIAAGSLIPSVTQRIAGAQDSPSGDVNGDSQLNVSDAVYLLVHLFRGGPAPVPAECDSSAPVSTILIVRHGEKDDGDDPGLLPQGHARARRLAEVLAPTEVDALIASDLRRTQETLQPLADAKSMAISEIAEVEDVVRFVESLPAGSTAVIAHHSFTIHGILEGLGLTNTREKVSVSGDNYDNLLLVERPVAGGPKLVVMKYGAPSS